MTNAQQMPSSDDYAANGALDIAMHATLTAAQARHAAEQAEPVTERPEIMVISEGAGVHTVGVRGSGGYFDGAVGEVHRRPSGPGYDAFVYTDEVIDGVVQTRSIGVARTKDAAVEKIVNAVYPPPPEPVRYDLSSLPAGWTLTVSINAETGAMQALLRNPLGEQVAVVTAPVGAGVVIS